MAVGVDVSAQPRRHKGVTFAHGPFKKYADGHPPEKATEQERRLYRKGLTLVRTGAPIVVTRAQGPDWSVSFFEAFQSAKADTTQRGPSPGCLAAKAEATQRGPSPGCLATQTRPPSLWESFETSLQVRREADPGLGALENVPLDNRGPRLLCRDSVTSLEVLVPPKAALGGLRVKGPMGKGAGGLEHDGLDMEALWSRASEIWDSGDGSPATGALEVEGVGTQPAGKSGCWAGVLEALGGVRRTATLPMVKDAPGVLQGGGELDGCWSSLPKCCRSLRHVFGFFSPCRGFMTVDTVDD